MLGSLLLWYWTLFQQFPGHSKMPPYSEHSPWPVDSWLCFAQLAKCLWKWKDWEDWSRTGIVYEEPRRVSRFLTEMRERKLQLFLYIQTLNISLKKLYCCGWKKEWFGSPIADLYNFSVLQQIGLLSSFFPPILQQTLSNNFVLQETSAGWEEPKLGYFRAPAAGQQSNPEAETQSMCKSSLGYLLPACSSWERIPKSKTAFQRRTETRKVQTSLLESGESLPGCMHSGEDWMPWVLATLKTVTESESSESGHCKHSTSKLLFTLLCCVDPCLHRIQLLDHGSALKCYSVGGYNSVKFLGWIST